MKLAFQFTVVMMLTLLSQAVATGDAISKEQQKDLLDKFTAVLPVGWRITKTEDEKMPDEWYSFAPGGYLVEGKRGENNFSIWFLPQDWIGIRIAVYSSPTRRYEILVGNGYKAIILSTSDSIPGCLRKMGMNTASIVNSGWWAEKEVFAGKFEQAQETAERLAEQHCKNQAARDQAAISLIYLGVPAKSFFLKTAIAGDNGAADWSISSLGCLGGKDSVKVLCQILKDPNSPDHKKHYAAMSSESIGDPDAGPALLEALKQAMSHDAFSVKPAVIQAIGRIRYQPAAPSVLEAMASTDHPTHKAECAETLASLRYTNAVPAIRLLAEADSSNTPVRFNLTQIELSRQTAQRSLLRLTGPWGEPSAEVRLLIEPPTGAVVGKAMNMTLYVENVSDKVLMITDYLVGAFTINGKTKENYRLFGIWNGFVSMTPNYVWSFKYDLSREISRAGRYSIQYEVRGAKSNLATLEVKAQ